MFSALKDKQSIEYPLVVKADTQGSVEAIVGSINKISTEDIKARVLHSGVGGITESDVTLAGASGAPIIGFNVRANAKAREIAVRQGVALKYYDIIRSEEHTSVLQSLMRTSYAVFCLTKKKSTTCQPRDHSITQPTHQHRQDHSSYNL